jgi:hypothetical protein
MTLPPTSAATIAAASVALEADTGAFAPGETREAFTRRIDQEWVDLHADDSPASLVRRPGGSRDPVRRSMRHR